jgi:UPF0755 protein
MTEPHLEHSIFGAEDPRHDGQQEQQLRRHRARRRPARRRRRILVLLRAVANL